MRDLVRMLGASLLLAVLSATVAQAQQSQARQDYASQARNYLDTGMAPHQALGYRRDATPDVVVPLRLDHPYLWSIYLERGVNYRVYGACDNDCSDLDMEIYGADGNLIDRDQAADDTPYVQITPVQSGRAYVRVWVYACSAEPCYAAMRVVSGGTPAARAQTAAATPPPALTDEDSRERVVRAELDAADDAHTQAGYTRFGADSVGAAGIASGAGVVTPVTLTGGVTYLFQGACDQQCTDVNLDIRNAHGEQIAEDINGDDRPVVTVTPPRDGVYNLHIWLAQCAIGPCYVGIRGYRRGH